MLYTCIVTISAGPSTELQEGTEIVGISPSYEEAEGLELGR